MRRPYGKVNLVGLVLLAAVAYGLWWLVIIGPAHLDNLDVKQALDEAINQAALGRQDDALASHIIQVTDRIGDHEADDGFGNITVQQGLGITRDQISIIRDEVHNNIAIRVEYTRVRNLKPLSRQRAITFIVEKEGALKR